MDVQSKGGDDGKETDELLHYSDMLQAYMLDKHKYDLLHIIDQPDPTDHYSVTIHPQPLSDMNMDLADYLWTCPIKLLAALDRALLHTQRTLIDNLPGTDQESVNFKPNIHARLLGVENAQTRDTLPKTSDIGKLLSVSGTVIRATTVKLLEYEKDFMCNKCKNIFSVQADFEQFYSVCRPTRCPNTDNCGNTMSFSSLNEKGSGPSKCRNYQEVKIQEQVQKLVVGTIPRNMWVTLDADLVDSCKPGDDVKITGIVMRRWKPTYVENKCDIELVLKGNHVQVTNEQRTSVLLTPELKEEFENYWKEHETTPFTGRNLILSSLCPQVYGLYIVKLAVTLILAGGVQRVDESGTRVRGESHLLLVGDPGTGKSQFLKYASKVMPRSVLTTGIGSTSAGLTVTAVKDGGEWQLEAGALVLADGGICCIDEFNSIKECDKTSIHEAMEQQSISVAKAGLVCKLNTRTSILASTNPKGRYDPEESLCVNIALASPLLSRFDLVLTLLDTQNEDWDRVVSTYILEGKHPTENTNNSNLWDMDKMQAYLCYIKTFKPEMTEQAGIVLSAYYKKRRQADGRNAARTTMRLLESLIRLSQAHARLMCHTKVEIQDAVVAASLMDSSQQGGALFTIPNALHTSFPEKAEDEYERHVEFIVRGLGLSQIADKEIRRLHSMKCNSASQKDKEPEPGHAPSPVNQTPSPPRLPPPPTGLDVPTSPSTRLAGVGNFPLASPILGHSRSVRFADSENNHSFLNTSAIGAANSSICTSTPLKSTAKHPLTPSDTNMAKSVSEEVNTKRSKSPDVLSQLSRRGLSNNQTGQSKNAHSKASPNTINKLKQFAFVERTDISSEEVGEKQIHVPTDVSLSGGCTKTRGINVPVKKASPSFEIDDIGSLSGMSSGGLSQVLDRKKDKHEVQTNIDLGSILRTSAVIKEHSTSATVNKGNFQRACTLVANVSKVHKDNGLLRKGSTAQTWPSNGLSKLLAYCKKPSPGSCFAGGSDSGVNSKKGEQSVIVPKRKAQTVNPLFTLKDDDELSDFDMDIDWKPAAKKKKP